MKQLKNYGIMLAYLLGGAIMISLILSILNYFNLFTGMISKSIIGLFVLTISIYAGYYCGKKAEKKGYIEGLKIGSLFILTLLLLNIIFFATSWNIQRMIYYVIILIACVIGSMIGINKKNSTK